MKSPLLREGLFVCLVANKRSFVNEHMFARERLFLQVTNVCSYKERTFVPLYNEQMFDTATNICSETGQPEQERMFENKEHMF